MAYDWNDNPLKGMEVEIPPKGFLSKKLEDLLYTDIFNN